LLLLLSFCAAHQVVSVHLVVGFAEKHSFLAP
jgi:hypothetical protein